MEDIAPELLAAIRKTFKDNINGSSKLKATYQLIQNGKATYADAEEYAYLVGEALSQAFGKHLSSTVLPDGRMYYNIADRVLRPLLEDDHSLVADAAEKVQTSLNKKANIGLKAQRVEVNTDRIDGIVDRVSNTEVFDNVSSELDALIKNFSMNVVDETLKANVESQGRAGLRPKIIREAERKCCDWCSGLAGEYDYPDVPEDVYRRHKSCRCTVEFDPADGKRKRQNVHTKEWTTEEQRAKIEARKQVGLKSTPLSLSEHPKRLASYTPSRLKTELESEGFEVKPLKNGSLKNIPFDDGGGFKVNFEDGGILQYHPETKSHHGGAYYKISTGKGGTHRYDLEGNEIDG